MREPGNRFSPIGSGVSADLIERVVPLFLAVAISALTVIRYWVLSAPYPPGLDGAQWLSYGHALFGGAGRDAVSTYAPVVPVVVHGIGFALGPFIGLRVAIAVVLVLVAVAVSVLSTQLLGKTWGPLTAALALPCTAITEPFFYGGLPQQAALACGLLGLTLVVRARLSMTSSSATRAFAAATICFVLASASHLLFGPLVLLSAALSALGLGAGRVDQRVFLFRSAVTLLPGALTSVLVAMAYFQHGYTAPLSASQRTLGEAWIYATRESPWLWAAIVVGGVLSSLFIVLKLRSGPPLLHERAVIPAPVIVGLALIVPSAVLMIASGQPRLAPPVLLGGAILAGFAGRTASRSSAHARFSAITACCAATLWLAGLTTTFAKEFAQFYQVLDASFVRAARSVPSPAAGAIAVAPDHRGWPVGWWVEALQTAPVFVGSDLRWLAFPEEQSRAEAVEYLLASPDGSVLQLRAENAGVAYLLLRKWDWIGWERWIASTVNAPAVVYDDNETIVLCIVAAPS